MQPTLFESASNLPLSERLRPKDLSQIVGQDAIVSYFKQHQERFRPCILFGPPGSGKTTIAKAVAREFNLELICFNAVLQGVAELKKILSESKNQSLHKQLLFIDEIHRFNKAQQDSLLEGLETSSLLFIGATTEKPQIALNPALLSRLNIFELSSLSQENLCLVLEKGLHFLSKKNIDPTILKSIAKFSDGDARVALRALEFLCDETSVETEQQALSHLKTFFAHSKHYDKSGNRHYDVISAFIKSIRGSNPDAALLWLAVMLESGEDPVFIARRLMIIASEDIGLASPSALMLANQAHYAVKNLGMPEARITLGHVTLALALMPKSNSAYLAIDKAIEYVRKESTIKVPDHLKNTGPSKANYLYPHSYNNHVVKQDYFFKSKEFDSFYQSTTQGHEQALYDHWKKLQDTLNT